MPSINPSCTDCPLHATATTVCVAGQGPPNAQIMLIGEAPGKTEDRYGVPFIGRAGDVLNELLTKTGFRRDQIYVTNVVKCRPADASGGDRTPGAKEIKACKHYLRDELAAVQPLYVVALGSTAFKALSNGTGLSAGRGAVHQLRDDYGSDAALFAAVHPAAALHSPQYQGQTEEDLRFLRRTIDDDFVDVDVAYIDCKPGPPPTDFDLWSFDIETNGRETRDPFASIYMVGVDYGNEAVQLVDNVAPMAVLLQTFVDDGGRLVGHNASRFDRLHIKSATGVNLRCDDTMLLAWLLHEEWGQKTVKKLNLQALCTHYLGVRPWKDDVTWDWSNPATIPLDEAKKYNARDTRYTRMLAQHLMPQLKADGHLWTFYDKLLLPASRALADMEERGIYVSPSNVAEARAYYEHLAQEALWEVQEIAAGHAGFDDFEFNPASTQQVARLLFGEDGFGYQPTEQTKGGKPSTAVGVMKTLRESNPDEPFFDKVLQYRRYRNKMLGTYIAHFEDEVDYWNMAYPWTALTQTVTGRTSSPWQQIPRNDIGPKIRRCIAARPGQVLLEADFSQLEMRVASSRYVFDEPNLRNAFEQGIDVHQLLAADICGVPFSAVTKEQRQNAKPPNFLFLYGGEEEMYRRTLLEDQDIVKPLDVARYERDTFFRRWSGLPAGHRRVVNELEAHGQVRTLFGTLRRLPNVRSGDRRTQVEAYREAVNVVVQAPACHAALIGLVLLTAAGFEVIKFDHDAYLIRLEDSEAVVRAAAAQIRHLLERGVVEVMASEFGIAWDVPLKVDMKCGTAWTEGDRNAWVS